MRTTAILALVFAALAAATPAPPTGDAAQNLCCPTFDHRSPRGTLIVADLFSNELCCGYSDGTTCCYALTGSLLTGNSCDVFLTTC